MQLDPMQLDRFGEAIAHVDLAAGSWRMQPAPQPGSCRESTSSCCWSCPVFSATASATAWLT